MGLIKTAVGAAGGVMADQWKEFFYCESMPKEVLVTKGVKRTSGRSSNTRGSDNIITSGSGIAVADGQCMMIVDQGKIVARGTHDELIQTSEIYSSISDSQMGGALLE